MNMKFIFKSFVFFSLFTTVFYCEAKKEKNLIEDIEYFDNGKMSTNVVFHLLSSNTPKIAYNEKGNLMNVRVTLNDVNLKDDQDSQIFGSAINKLNLLERAELVKDKNNVMLNLKFNTQKAFVKFITIDNRRFKLEVYSTEELEKLERSIDGPVLLTLNSESSDGVFKKKDKSDFCIVLDPGHGGDDYGACDNGVIEKNLALDIARRMRYILKKAGYKVFLTRDEDKFIPLIERNRIAQKLGADLFVSVHLNAAANTNASGIETYHPEAKALGLINNKQSFCGATKSKLLSVVEQLTLKKVNLSTHLADKIQNSLLDTLDSHKLVAVDRGVRNQSFCVLLYGNFPSALVELGFLTNKKEAQMLKNRDYRTFLAYGVSKGIDTFVKKTL